MLSSTTVILATRGGTSCEQRIRGDRRDRGGFDDGSLVADAGLLLAGTVMSRLGLEALIDETVRPGGSAGSGAGRKVLSLVASMLVGGRCIDDVQRLRSGSAAAVLPFAVVAPRLRGFLRRSRSGMCAARQGGRAGASPGVVCGRRARGGRWLAVRCAARPSTAPPTATPRCWAITRWWRCAQTPARWHSRMRSGSSARPFVVRPWRACGAWGRLRRRCAPTRGSSPMT